MDPVKHAEDVVAAVESISHSPHVDDERVGLVGFSMGGGVVALAGAELQGRVKAIVTQGASLDGFRNVMFNLENRGALGVLRIIFSALTDVAR